MEEACGVAEGDSLAIPGEGRGRGAVGAQGASPQGVRGEGARGGGQEAVALVSVLFTRAHLACLTPHQHKPPQADSEPGAPHISRLLFNPKTARV